MRFIAGGPNLPDLLLERRDQGRVVFLCGAGVSCNAGLPTFIELTRDVLNYFDPPDDSDLAKAFQFSAKENERYSRPKESLDHIFQLLQQEYGRKEVNIAVANLLKKGDATGVSREHDLISKLSTNEFGCPQIVTTNFDLLFETCSDVKGLPIYEPPALPDLNLGVSVKGLTYLHGRLKTDHPEQRYILSSADFGRAYLSEGWATNFVRGLLKTYTVVLVGYKADDPPIKYLLQGLNHDGKSDRSNLYAFERGLPEVIESKWRDRGVTPIAYSDHKDLWGTLECWADRSRDPRQWRSNIVEMARSGPRDLEPHQRGQVAHLVKTTAGARLFARSEPPPPAEWLCVFDSLCRTAEEYPGSEFEAERFNPRAAYGLDDDPLKGDDTDPEKVVADHLLEWRHGDINPFKGHRLDGGQRRGWEEIPYRLFYLANWIAKLLGSPLAAWWVGRKKGLHPRLLENLRVALSRAEGLSPRARTMWNFLIEYQSQPQILEDRMSWYDLKARIDVEGWSPSVLRLFENVSYPVLSVQMPFGLNRVRPPFNNWDDIESKELPRCEVVFADRHRIEIEPPDNVLLAVFQILERSLVRAISFMNDPGIGYFETPTCYPDREIIGEKETNNTHFGFFLKLFQRVIISYPSAARAYADLWSIDETHYFRKIKLFALNQRSVYQPDEVATFLLSMKLDIFWDERVAREILFLILDRWVEFSPENKTKLADRLLSGPDWPPHMRPEKYPQYKSQMTCRYTRWLVLQGLELSREDKNRLDNLIESIPQWNDSWASEFLIAHNVLVTSFGIDADPNTIIDKPLSDIIPAVQLAQQYDFDATSRKRPFYGIVKRNPRKALAVLSLLARKGEYPAVHWIEMLEGWPDSSRPRLLKLFLYRLYQWPDDLIKELGQHLCLWLEKGLPTAWKLEPILAWKLFDRVLACLAADGGVATKAGKTEYRVLGKLVSRSRRTIASALNGPIGRLTEGLLDMLAQLGLDKEQKIPAEFKFRMEKLLECPGEGADHSSAVLSRHIGWLHHIDSEWVVDHILKYFSFDHIRAEPAWNGFLSQGRLPTEELLTLMKPHFTKLFPCIYQWQWDVEYPKIAVQMIVDISIFYNDQVGGLTIREARNSIRSMNDKNRKDAIFWLSQIGEVADSRWNSHVIPFIDNVWPREKAYMTSGLVSAWVSLLEKSGEQFPKVLSSVRKFLVPAEKLDHSLFSFSGDVYTKPLLSTQFPVEVLELLDAIIPDAIQEVPYSLQGILAKIEEAQPSLVRDHRLLRLFDLIERM